MDKMHEQERIDLERLEVGMCPIVASEAAGLLCEEGGRTFDLGSPAGFGDLMTIDVGTLDSWSDRTVNVAGLPAIAGAEALPGDPNVDSSPPPQ